MTHLKLPAALRAATLALFVLSLTRCIVPYESARMLPKGAFELKAANTYGVELDESEAALDNVGLGFGLGYGISDRVNAKIRFERHFLSDAQGAVNFLSFGPKFALVPDKFAMMFPVGLYFGDGNSTWGLHPGFLFTLPAKSNRFETTFGARTDIFLESESDLLIGLNLGFGFSNNLDVWAIRPDLGLVFSPGERGSVFTFGVGVNYNLLSKKETLNSN